VREINDVTSAISNAISQQDLATREISQNAQLAAQGNGTLVVNIGSLSDAMGKTSTAAASVLTASSDLTATAETRFIVVPMRPAGTDGWSEDKLARLVTRNCMIGTGLPLRPEELGK